MGGGCGCIQEAAWGQQNQKENRKKTEEEEEGREKGDRFHCSYAIVCKVEVLRDGDFRGVILGRAVVR